MAVLPNRSRCKPLFPLEMINIADLNIVIALGIVLYSDNVAQQDRKVCLV